MSVFILDLATTFLESFMMCYLLEDEQKEDISRMNITVYYVLFSLMVIFMTVLNINILLKITISTVVFLISAQLVYHVRKTTLVYKFLLCYIIFVAGEAVSVLALGLLSPDNLVEFEHYRFFKVELYLIAKTINFILVVVVKRYFRRRQDNLMSWRDISVPGLMGIAILMITGNIFQFVRDTDGRSSLGITLGIGLLVVSFVCNVIYNERYLDLRQQQQEEQAEQYEMNLKYRYYQDKMENEERIRSIYHDLKNHLLILEESFAGGGETREMIDTLKAQISDYDGYYHTGNEFLDIIIREKHRVSLREEIDFMAVVAFENGGFIEPLDISTIFGNALDNAIEACVKLPEEERFITVRADRIYDFLSISVENSMIGAMRAGPEPVTDKEDKFLHGIGIANLRKAVEKYHGSCIRTAQSGIYGLKILIPLPEERTDRFDFDKKGENNYDHTGTCISNLSG